MEVFSEAEKEELRQWALAKGIGHFRCICPACSPTRKNKKLECVSATVDAEKVLAKCWHCQKQGAVRLEKPSRAPSSNRNYNPPPKPSPQKKTAIKEIGLKLDPICKAWLKERGISEETAEHFGLVWARAYFLNIKRETAALAYPYIVDGKTVGHKARSMDDKDHVCAPALYSLFGLQNVDIEEEASIVICEGEPDALSMYEAGVLNATSVPNGASSFARTTDENDKRAAMGFLWTAKKQIDAAKKIIIACDADSPGEKLAEELSRRIGRHRCWRVSYPEGCKDANDVLLKHGKAALKECVEKAEPWPIDGLYEAEDFYDSVFELFRDGFGDRVETGLPRVDKLYSIGKGLLTVITGVPGNGKSQFVDQLMINTARRYGYIHAICSFENPVHVHIGKLAQVLMQRHFFDSVLPGSKMSEEELHQALPFIHRHFKFLQQEDGKKSTIESIIERIETAVFRWGINCVVIDPYNYIARPTSAESETQFIDDILTRLRLVAAHYGLHIWFIAHPTKLSMDAEGHYQIPKGYSISGSSAWFSKPDFGLTVHRVPDAPGLVKIIVWKVRFDWLGQVGETEILYDNVSHVYLDDALSNSLPWNAQEAGYG